MAYTITDKCVSCGVCAGRCPAHAIELKDGETTYLNARLDFYNTLLNYDIAVAGLEKEIGIPLEPTEGNVLDNNVDKQL